MANETKFVVIYILESGQDIQKCRFATSRRSQNCNQLASIEFPRKVLQDLLVWFACVGVRKVKTCLISAHHQFYNSIKVTTREQERQNQHDQETTSGMFVFHFKYKNIPQQIVNNLLYLSLCNLDPGI